MPHVPLEIPFLRPRSSRRAPSSGIAPSRRRPGRVAPACGLLLFALVGCAQRPLLQGRSDLDAQIDAALAAAAEDGASGNIPTRSPFGTNVVGAAAVGRDVVPAGHVAEPRTVAVPAARTWTETGLHVEAGQPLAILAHGRITVRKPSLLAPNAIVSVGPEGSYFFGADEAERDFPLPAAGNGPAPVHCLIGRIGEGPPFVVGASYGGAADRSGPLRLGVNDFDPTDNEGSWYATVEFPESVPPVRYEQVVRQADSGPVPAVQPGRAVVVFYVDGLRPDVVREMAALGHLPNIRRHFLDGGVWMQQSYTAFPSDTITSNGTMWTGCFSDRHGLKGQVRFSRRTLESESYLEPLGPNRSARLLAPQGIDRIVRDAEEASLKAVQGPLESRRWHEAHASSVPPLYEHLRRSGADWATGVLPIMTEVPPLLWTRSLVRNMPYFRAHEAWQYIDDANAHYASHYLLDQERPATVIWLPETDSVSHKLSRGQFGTTRRTIAQADALIGRIASELEARGRLEHTYLMLVSDHGHHGGRTSYLSHFDIAGELLHKPREVDEEGRWTGGGLGLSVRQHRFWNRHPEHGSRSFAFVDGDSDGAARIFLPRGNFSDGDWSGPNRPGDLLAYRIAPGKPPVDLVSSILATRSVHGDGTLGRPVDLVLAKLGQNSILVATHDRGRAVIDRRPGKDGRWEYRYRPVENVRPADDGNVAYDPIPVPRTDPLGIVPLLPAHVLDYWHDERTWLRITTRTAYPDSVVTLSRHMLWQEGIAASEAEYAPDLVVTARPNWYFGTASSPGTMHGYPLADAMRASWFLSGPGLRRGARVVDPCRLADLTPTILALTGTVHDPTKFDGQALTAIWEAPQGAGDVPYVPVRFEELDLRGWQPLKYEPLPPYEHNPIEVNRPASPFDLNNVAYNLLSIGDLSVLRLFDDVLFPLRRQQHPLADAVERGETKVRATDQEWIGEAAGTVDLTGLAVSDYSMTSLGNLKRADRAVDYVQNRVKEVDQKIAAPAGRETLPGSRPFHTVVDTAQGVVWETYRFAQRVVVQVLDETVLNGVENGATRAINRFRTTPSEIRVPGPGASDEPVGRARVDAQGRDEP